MTPRTPALVAALAALAIGSAHGQTCTDPHYRWTVKTTLALQGAASTAATPSAILKWTPLALYRPAVGAHDGAVQCQWRPFENGGGCGGSRGSPLQRQGCLDCPAVVRIGAGLSMGAADRQCGECRDERRRARRHGCALLGAVGRESDDSRHSPLGRF